MFWVDSNVASIHSREISPYPRDSLLHTSYNVSTAVIDPVDEDRGGTRLELAFPSQFPVGRQARNAAVVTFNIYAAASLVS